MDILSHFYTAVEKALYAVSNGCDVREELASLEPFRRELRQAFDNLLLRPDPIAAAVKSAATREQRRNEQVFQIWWRGGGEMEYVTGWSSLAKKTALSTNSINVYLSKGKGSFSLLRTNPVTGEKDQLNVVRLLREDEPKPKRGRPRTRMTEQEYIEATQNIPVAKPKSARNNKIPTDDPTISES